VRVIDLGRIAYQPAVDEMIRIRDERIAGSISDTLLICEHDPVYTVGRTRGADANILRAGDVPIERVARGGDVTFHGPGQIVGYPIFQLPEHRHDLHGFLRGLEETMIRTLNHYGLDGKRDDRNTGVWVDGRKMMAIGIAAKRWVTWHGFALNHTTELDYFQRINPCGMSSQLVTRLADHMDAVPTRAALISTISDELRQWWEDWTGIAG
jgi:lipoyl(octanoyl) transferase